MDHSALDENDLRQVAGGKPEAVKNAADRAALAARKCIYCQTGLRSCARKETNTSSR